MVNKSIKIEKSIREASIEELDSLIFILQVELKEKKRMAKPKEAPSPKKKIDFIPLINRVTRTISKLICYDFMTDYEYRKFISEIVQISFHCVYGEDIYDWLSKETSELK